MTTQMIWRYKPKKTEVKCLSDEIKFALGEHLWGEHFRSEHSGNWLVLEESLIPFLQGLRCHANFSLKKEIDELIELIQGDCEIEINLRH